jgi:predicted RNA-binding protein with PUA domain
MNPEKDPPGATGEECICNRNHPEEGCTNCGKVDVAYWCEVCQQNVPEKRCPLCGLKARKVR